MKKLMLILIAVSCLAFSATAWARNGTGDEAFFKANQDYRAGRYEEAAGGYRELAASGGANGHVYYDLGNALLKEGRPGEAILNYQRAALLIPRDADLAFNRTMALDQAGVAGAPPGEAFSSVFFWLPLLSMPEAFAIFAGLHALLFGALTLRLFLRRDWSYYLLMVCFFAWFTGALTFGLKYMATATDHRAVVVAKKADALAGPEKGDTVLFRLQEGAFANIERADGAWVLVSLPDGKRGWMKAAEVKGIVDRNLEARLLPF
jgi:tetratricopeptide (TPR) repeat protein